MVMANHLIKDIETSIKRGGAVSKAKVNKGKKGKAPWQEKEDHFPEIGQSEV